jgi:4'-phosphopantetheinyl transferase
MSKWSAVPSLVALAEDAVHVWSVPLVAGPPRLSRLWALLDPEERKRAARFTHVPSRDQFIVARGTLRVLLGRYLNCAPTAVRLEAEAHGKPVLVSPASELHFNVSHTTGLALIAVTRVGPVGIDVEHVRHMPTHLDMAQRFFTPRESAALSELPAPQSVEAFFHVWTRKEAFLKAVGLGLSHGLERFEVSVPPDDPARILHIDGSDHEGARWSLCVLDPQAGYVGAVVFEGQAHLVCRTFDGA